MNRRFSAIGLAVLVLLLTTTSAGCAYTAQVSYPDDAEPTECGYIEINFSESASVRVSVDGEVVVEQPAKAVIVEAPPGDYAVQVTISGAGRERGVDESRTLRVGTPGETVTWQIDVPALKDGRLLPPVEVGAGLVAALIILLLVN